MASEPTWVVTSSTGSALLAAAGLLRGRTAATHWLAGPLLERHGVTVVPAAHRRRRPVRHVLRAGRPRRRRARRDRPPRRPGLGQAVRTSLATIPPADEPVCESPSRYRPRRGRPAPGAAGATAPPRRRGATPPRPTRRRRRRRGRARRAMWHRARRRRPIARAIRLGAIGGDPRHARSGGRAPSCSATARPRSSARSARATPPALAAFHERQSPESIYRRFFSPKPRLTDADLEHFTVVDFVDRVALVVERYGEFIAWASYERWPGRDDADAAFQVDDAHHGKGIATLLLEHLAAIARSQRDRPLHGRGARRQPPDARRVQPRRLAGRATLRERRRRPRLLARRHRGVPRLGRAARAARRLAGDGPAAPAAHDRRRRRQRRAGLDRRRPVAPRDGSRHRRRLPGQPGPRRGRRQALVAAPAGRPGRRQPGRRRRAGRRAAGRRRGLHRGAGARRRHHHVDRGHGHRHGAARRPGPPLRRAPDRARHRWASPRRASPSACRRCSCRPTCGPGGVAISLQSGSLGASVLRLADDLHMGLSWFVSLGDKSDVSGNDLLQFWEDDEATKVIAMYTESFGNPRKFARIARRVSRRRPIVAVRTGAAAIGASGGALYQQAGLIEVPTVAAMLDTARVLATQPVMRGPRVALLANARSPATLSRAALHTAGLEAVDSAVPLDWRSTPDDYGAALRAALADDDVDGVLIVHAPPLADGRRRAGRRPSRRPPPARRSRSSRCSWAGATARCGPARRCRRSPSPSRPPVCSAARACTARGSPTRPTRRSATSATSTGRPPAPIITAALARGDRRPRRRGRGRRPARLRRRSPRRRGGARRPRRSPWPSTSATRSPSRPSTATSAARCGPASPSTSPTPHDVTDAVRTMQDALGADADVVVVQPMVAPGLDLRIRSTLDDRLGPLVAIGLGGSTADLVTGEASRLAPLSAASATALLAGSRAGPALHQAGLATAPVVDVLMRVAQLVSDHDEIEAVDLNPIIASERGHRRHRRRRARPRPAARRRTAAPVGVSVGVESRLDGTRGHDVRARPRRPPVPPAARRRGGVDRRLPPARRRHDARVPPHADAARPPRQRVRRATSSVRPSTTCGPAAARSCRRAGSSTSTSACTPSTPTSGPEPPSCPSGPARSGRSRRTERRCVSGRGPARRRGSRTPSTPSSSRRQS